MVHIQIPSLSKGKSLDSIVRPIEHKGKNGEIAKVYTVDLLIATNRKHAKLIEDIESGKMKTLSMGCIATCTQC